MPVSEEVTVAPVLLLVTAMRVTGQMLSRMLGENISSNQEAIYKLQQQITTGRKIIHPSDDPGAYESIRRLHVDTANIEQYSRNAELAERELLSAETALQGVLDILQYASEIAIRGSDGTVSVADRINLGKEVDQLLESAIDLANTSEGGRYVFAGLRTDQQAYTATDTDLDGFTDTVTYDGSHEVKRVEIGKGIYVDVNTPGSDAAGTNGVFETNDPDVNVFTNLMTLRDRLLAGQNIVNTDSLDKLNHSIDHMINIISITGAREEKVHLNSGLLSQTEVNLRSALQQQEAVDVARAIMDLSERQTAYEASLRSTAMILDRTSLMHYL